MKILEKFSNEELETFLNESFSLWDFCKKVGYKNKSSRVYTSVKNNLSKRNINLEKYPVLWKRIGLTRKKDDKEIFSKDSTYERKDLKRKIIKENLLPYKCSCCGIFDWLGNPLSLQLDHINGVNNDNRLENLRFLCPNCHTQTPTWGYNNR
jgi:hypothetical protein